MLGDNQDDVLDLLDLIERGFDDIEHRIANMDKEHTKYVRATVTRMNYLLSGETDTKGLVVQLLNKMSEDPDQMEEIITETGKRMNLSLLEILSEKSLYKRRKSRKDFISQLLPDETTGDLDKDDILRLNRIQMRFSKKQIEEFIENNMEDEVMDASKINIADEEEFEKLILAYDYSTRKNSRYMVLEEEPEMVEKAGYRPGEEVAIALDVAASELYDKNFKKYVFDGEAKKKGYKIVRSAEELIDYYEDIIEKYPIVSIEDPLDEDDWEGWKTLTDRLGERVQLVGDDLFVTNTRRLAKGIRRKAANAILIKVNQIGTLTESFEAVKMAQNAGYKTVISHRSGETADSFIADIAVAADAGQIKTGAPCRSERVEKYNQLLRIEERLGDVAVYQNPFEEKIENVQI